MVLPLSPHNAALTRVLWGAALRRRATLLGGLVACGVCGRRMFTTYTDCLGRRTLRFDLPDYYRPADALDRALQAIAERYGERATNVVAMQLAYPRSGEVR